MAENNSPLPPMQEVEATLQAVRGNITTVLEEVGSKTGRVLVKFNYVVALLGGYTLLSLFTGVWLTIDLGAFRGLASMISYEVSTGGSPLPFIRDIEKPFPYLWAWLLFFRVISWLIVPVLIATAVDAAYRILETRRAKALRRMRRRFRRECEREGVTDPDALEKCVDRKIEQFWEFLEGPTEP